MVLTETEFTVTLVHRTGALADLGEALGDAKVNIEALQACTTESEGVVRFVVNDVRRATEALKGAGIPFATREVLAVNLLNEPGTLGDVARVMAAGDINIESAYVTVGGLVILGVDDLAGATEVAKGLAVDADA
jgi:hypothetical protein